MVDNFSSPAYQAGPITWLGSYDLAMPIHEDVEPLVRKDLHAKFMAQMLTCMPERSPSPRGTCR